MFIGVSLRNNINKRRQTVTEQQQSAQNSPRDAKSSPRDAKNSPKNTPRDSKNTPRDAKNSPKKAMVPHDHVLVDTTKAEGEESRFLCSLCKIGFPVGQVCIVATTNYVRNNHTRSPPHLHTTVPANCHRKPQAPVSGRFRVLGLWVVGWLAELFHF